MQFLKRRIKYIGRIAHWWWAVIYGLAWSLLCSIDVLIGHYASESFKAAYNKAWVAPKWGWAVWIIGLLVITILVIIEGSYRYASNLEDRIAPKLEIPQIAYEQPLAQGAMTHYFDVSNESYVSTVTEVKVNLRDMEPPPRVAKWLPIPLHIKHDQNRPAERESNINPRDKIQIDLVSAPRNAPFFWIVDVVIGTATGGWTQIDWVDVPSGVCTLTVTASGRDVPQAEGKFDVYKDMAGYLRCVPSKLR
jgi:hypothetical protein